MKKVLLVSILFVIIFTICTTMVSATTNAELPDKLMSICQKYGATSTDKMKLERYLADNPVSEAEANAIVRKANEAAEYMDSIGATNVNQLTPEQKKVVKAKANEAASIVGVTLSFKNNDIQVYKNGKLIDITPVPTAPEKAGAKKLVYTGSNGYIVLTVAGIATVALATIAVIRKKVVND